MVPNFPGGRPQRTRVALVMAVSASLLTAGATNPSPSAASDDHSNLQHRKHRLERAIDGQRSDVDEMSTRLLRTSRRLGAAIGELTEARAALADIREQVEAAARVDRRMQQRLTLAIAKLTDAEADLAQGRSDVLDNRAELAAYAVSSYQAGGSLSLGVAFQSTSPQEAVDNLQVADTVLAKQSVTLQEVQATRVLLRLTLQRVEEAKDAVAEQRAIAAGHLRALQDLRAQAEAAKQTVATRVAGLRDVRRDMAAAKRQELHRLHTLKTERDRIQERLTRIAERRARRQQRSASASSQRQADAGFLSYPVRNTYVTSPYGMRMHPILHILSLHDGTDFHANCGSPVYAAADGRVMSEYFNTGYGNRLIVDHGFVKGVSLSTSYNHLTSFVAGVGEHVERGEVIAYSGTTGYSTGCHLHFMVYVNGYTVDPSSWL